MRTAVVALSFTLPLWMALPSISDPFGQSEASLNAAIWALGARNILEHGPVDAAFGALVAPFHGVQDGIYAHHPPLPVWVSTLTVLFGGHEAIPRLIAILCALVTLVLVHRIVRRETSAPIAFAAVLFASSLPYVLIYARLLTTLTIAAPLFLWLLDEALEGRRSWRIVVAAALVCLSSWDGVIAAGGVVVLLLVRRERALTKIVLAAAAAGVLVDALYIVNASGGLDDVLHQAVWRSGVRDEALTWSAFVSTQWGFVSLGLSLVGVAAIALRALGVGRVLSAAFWTSLLPGMAMILVFRHGAQRHAFWGYLLWIPATFAIAALLTRIEQRRPVVRAATVCVLLVALVFNALAAHRVLVRERQLDEVGAFAKVTLAAHTASPVKMLAGTSFQVYIPWYLRFELDVALTREDFARRLAGAWKPSDAVMADLKWIEAQKCRPPQAVIATSRNGRFVVAQAAVLAEACAL